MFAHDWWGDLNTGVRHAWKNRIWLIREGDMPLHYALTYHWHPNPEFILGDEFIAYTTWALGRLDFALVRVSDLV